MLLRFATVLFLEEDSFQNEYVITYGRENLTEIVELDDDKRQSLGLRNPLIQDIEEKNPLLKATPKQGHGKKCSIC